MKLVLGVMDVAYSEANGGGATTTGDVAEILERRYHVMESFYESRQAEIAEWLAESVADKISDIVGGAPPGGSPFMAAEQNIETAFRQFLDAGEMEKILPKAQQIAAAQAGISHRKKHPHSSKNKARVAFVDTGLYEASFRAWIDE